MPSPLYIGESVPIFLLCPHLIHKRVHPYFFICPPPYTLVSLSRYSLFSPAFYTSKSVPIFFIHPLPIFFIRPPFYISESVPIFFIRPPLSEFRPYNLYLASTFTLVSLSLYEFLYWHSPLQMSKSVPIFLFPKPYTFYIVYLRPSNKFFIIYYFYTVTVINNNIHLKSTIKFNLKIYFTGTKCWGSQTASSPIRWGLLSGIWLCPFWGPGLLSTCVSVKASGPLERYILILF